MQNKTKYRFKKKIKTLLGITIVSIGIAYFTVYSIKTGYFNSYSSPFVPSDLDYYMFINGYKYEDIDVFIPDAPLQKKIWEKKIITSKSKEYDYVAISDISFKARVLAKKRYYRGEKAKISPYDLGLGWVGMSKLDVVSKIKFTHNNRQLYKESWGGVIEDYNDVVLDSANMHIIPISNKMRSTLAKIEKYDVVEIEGYLVDVRGLHKEFVWNSSKTRSDRGERSGEIVYVTKLEILEPPIKLE